MVIATAAFWTSMDLIAVHVVKTKTGPMYTNTWSSDARGWSVALRYEPAWPANVELALAPILWLWALWLRAPKARFIGALLSTFAVMVQAICAETGRHEGVTEFYAGYWVWLGSGVLTVVAFAVLPEPHAIPGGEPLPREVVLSARRRFALLLALIGTAFVVSTQFLWTAASPLDVVVVPVSRGCPVPTVFVAFGTLTGACLATGLLSAPILFAWAARRRARWAQIAGVTLCAALVIAQAVLMPRGYWPRGWTDEATPQLMHWYAAPVLLCIALALLPISRVGDATRR